MSETKEEQRKRLERKRISEPNGELIKCLECELRFNRVGSHVVQVHGYESVAEYRQEHGLMARETRVESHAQAMRSKAKTLQNLEKGKATRFKKSDRPGDGLRAFWDNRRKKKL